jgi:hypothetical protein
MPNVDPDQSAALRRLIRSLDPQDDTERGLLLALSVLIDPQRLHRLADMTARVASPTTSQAAVLDQIRGIAYLPSRTMTAAEQMRRIRDLLGEHYGVFTDPEDDA